MNSLTASILIFLLLSKDAYSEENESSLHVKGLLLITKKSLQSACYNLYGETQTSDGLCMFVDDCTGAALAGNCSNKNHICCKSDTKSNYRTENFIFKKNFFKIVNNTKRNQELYGYFSESIALANIKTNDSAIAYLTQLIGETNYFRNFESSIEENDTNTDIGNEKIGDGSKYRGRGGILIKGKKNYQAANSALISEHDFILNPERAAYPSVAFKIAAWIWKNNKLNKTKSTSTKITYLSLKEESDFIQEKNQTNHSESYLNHNSIGNSSLTLNVSNKLNPIFMNYSAINYSLIVGNLVKEKSLLVFLENNAETLRVNISNSLNKNISSIIENNLKNILTEKKNGLKDNEAEETKKKIEVKSDKNKILGKEYKKIVNDLQKNVKNLIEKKNKIDLNNFLNKDLKKFKKVLEKQLSAKKKKQEKK